MMHAYKHIRGQIDQSGRNGDGAFIMPDSLAVAEAIEEVDCDEVVVVLGIIVSEFVDGDDTADDINGLSREKDGADDEAHMLAEFSEQSAGMCGPNMNPFRADFTV